MITTKDIARLCGVSVTTVNRALNDKPDVNPDTKQRIVQVAEQNGYQPDILARRLVQGHSKVIGVLASDLENPFFSRFVIHLQRSAKARGYTIHTSIIENHPGDEVQALVELVSLRVDGIAYIPINEGAEYEAAVRKLGVPVVTLINRLSAGFDFVGTNEAEIMAQLTTAALDRGYVNLLYVHPQGEHDPRRNHYSLGQRRTGVVSVLEHDPRVRRWEELLHDIQWDRYAHKIRTWPGKTALICFNDLQAITAMKHLRAFGLEPGVNYGLSGYDRLPLLEYFKPQITTIDYPIVQIAESAIEFLIAAVESKDDRPPRERIIPSQIVFADTL